MEIAVIIVCLGLGLVASLIANSRQRKRHEASLSDCRARARVAEHRAYRRGMQDGYAVGLINAPDTADL